MKRDMDLVREIVLALDQLPADRGLKGIEGVETPTFAAHVLWLAEAGLVTATFFPSNGQMNPTYAEAWRLTWSGCEFADAIRSDTLWKKAKEDVIKPSASWTFTVLLDWLKAEISKGLPTLGG
jgi:hypothetical protein